MADTELVPQIPMEGLQKANAELSNLTLTLASYETQAKALVVQTPEQYAQADYLLKKVRDNAKQGTWIMQPFKSIAKTITEKFRTMELAHINKAEQIAGMIEPKMIQQKQREREAAQAEERRINEENRKRAEEQAEASRKAERKNIAEMQREGDIGKREADRLRNEADEKAHVAAANVQEVTVMENTPKISGLRQRVNYYAEGEYLNRFMDAYLKADATERAFLLGFIEFDQKAIGAFARQVKDDKKVMARIPGVRAWHEDSI